MTIDEAIELLKFHSFTHEDLNNPKMETGFLGSLRPYKDLREENFHEIMAVIRVLVNELQKDRLEHEIIISLWGIWHFARAWGVSPDGMLQRNKLITAEDVKN